MIRKSKRCISLLLIAVLLVGIVPTAYATETATSSTASEETTSEVTEATEPLDPTEPTEPTAPPENEDFESADLPAMSEAGLSSVPNWQMLCLRVRCGAEL